MPDKFSKLVAQPQKLIDMVDYQKGSVVSRELISRRTGTVTLFAFDEGQGLSEHTAPYDAMIQILDGEAEITVAGTLFHLKTGEMVVIPAKKPHALKATKRFKMILTMIRS
jgi:quercetin dioxygenase-like cupin family protein